MSKSEGEILKNFVKSKGIGISMFAKMLGYADRQGLNYQLSKHTLDYELKEKASRVLGVEMDDIFSQPVKSKSVFDSEKDTLRELVETQKSLISYQNELIAAQLIRLEAFESVILARIAEIEFATVPDKKNQKGLTLDDVLDEAESDVSEKIEEIKQDIKRGVRSLI